MMTDAELDALTDTETRLAQRLAMLSVHPDAATRQDVAEMAAELMDCRRAIGALQEHNEALQQRIEALEAERDGEWQ